MSTLEMFRQEGHKEGLEIGTKLNQLANTLNIIKKVPSLSTATVSDTFRLPLSFINKIKTTNNKTKLLQIIHKQLFVQLPLTEDNQKTIETMVDEFLV